MLKSLFTLVAVAQVVKDKDRGSDLVTVHPVELFPEANTNLNKKDSTKLNINNLHTGSVNISTESDYNITCKWLPIESGNRITPPDLCKGETVWVYRYSNTDMFFWVDVLKELDLRGKEIVTYAYSNTTKFKEKLSKTNSYWLTYDTVNKYVQLHTSDNDGELTTYDFKINTEDGLVTLIDGKDNTIKLNSDDDQLNITINELIEIECKNKNIFVDETIHTTSKNMDTEIEENINTTATTINIKVKEDVNITCDTANVAANSAVNVKSSDIVLKGDSITLDGETTVTKNINITGMSSAKDHLSGQVSGLTHFHTNAIPGSPTPPMPTGSVPPKYKP